MRGNSIGHNLVLTSFGESHGTALGAVLDGVPAGIALSVDDFARDLARRRPGQSDITTARNEGDVPEILSGVFEGKTLGTPIAVIVRNRDQRSGDYDPAHYRPGHADRAWEDKYGVRDYRGGGRASGRETIARVIAGTVAGKILPADMRIVGYTHSVGEVAAGHIPPDVSRDMVDAHPTRCPDPEAAGEMQRLILRYKEEGDSLGGIAELRISGVPAGLGEPVFRKVKSELAAAITSIGAVGGIMFGLDAKEFFLPGTVFHEESPSGIAARTHGIQGGITNGEDILLRVFIKPPSTTGDAAKRGRHDPCIIPRVVPVLEAMAALTLADLYLGTRLDRI